MATVLVSNSVRLLLLRQSSNTLCARVLPLPRPFLQTTTAATATHVVVSLFSTLKPPPPPPAPPLPPPPHHHHPHQEARRCDDKAKLEEEKGGAVAVAVAADGPSRSVIIRDHNINVVRTKKHLPGESHESVMKRLMGEPVQAPAGRLWQEDNDDHHDNNNAVDDNNNTKKKKNHFIPEVQLHAHDGRHRKRILMLCTGGTLTMAPDPHRGGALAPVQGALSAYMHEHMEELNNPGMPEIVLHEYTPFVDSSDLGPADWARLALDIKANYYHYDGFVILTGTDTMAYCATALSFLLENLGKPVIFTGSQIPLSEPYNDGRRNLIMALIFASRDTINEVSIFFHDRLLRACRATKVNTHRLLAFDSPNMDPLATIGITINENEHLILPQPRGALRVHSRMETRLLTIRLVPGFDDAMIAEMIQRNTETEMLRAIVLQLYGTGNMPSLKKSFIQLLADAAANDILVLASSQCHTGSVLLGHYAVGQALQEAGVVSAADMTLEAIACKVGYLYGRGDLKHEEVAKLMGVSLRGEMTPAEALSPPPLSSAYQRAIRKGKKYY